MASKKNKITRRIIALLLMVTFWVSPSVYATGEYETAPRASSYLTSYNTYMYNAAFGKMQVYFNVTGVNYMDEIGALTVKIYESTDNTNWTWVETYKHASTSGMLGYNKVYHSGHVDYQGTIGRYYKAYVTIWAGKDGDGDTRYYWTQSQKATLLAG